MPLASALVQTPEIQSLVGGQHRAGAGHKIPVINPANERTVALLQEADTADVGDAVAAARKAFDQGPWPRMDADDRKAILYRVRDKILEHSEELVELEVRHTGLPISSLGWQVARTARNFEMFGDAASLMAGQTYSQNPKYLTYVTREPKGVGALIAPWNAPLALASMRVATCIAFGNTCVLKPSEYTPLSMLRMVELIHEAGVPDGVVNLVNGRGHVTGQALVSNPGVDMVAFTGGTMTGRSIAAAAGQNLKPVILELGGKSASIVFESADLDLALDGALHGIFTNNGQQCLAGSRILLQRGIADAFMEKFVTRAQAMRIGDPMDPSTELGPLGYKAHMERVLQFADDARADGSTIITGGRRAAGFEAGYYIEPTAVLANSNADKICREEIFGPFATFVLFDTLDEAISIANDSAFGLVSYVWTTDLTSAMRCSREIRAGVVWVNTPMMRELRAPFGGYKDSGFGRDGVVTSADFFTEYKTTSIALETLAIPRIGLGGR
jgi:acyl-CoA reductase-like NAD-dependent aldehyde dehydrogenase